MEVSSKEWVPGAGPGVLVGRQAVVRKGAAKVSKNAGKQKQAIVKMEIGAGGGQVVAPGEQMRQVVTDAGGKAVPDT